MKIFLTGATGFIGQALLPLLKNHQVLALSHNEQIISSFVEICNFDLNNQKKLKDILLDFSPEVAVHLAWEGLPDYSFDKCLQNFNMGVYLIETLGKTGCKKIFCAGTCWEYGDLLGEVFESQKPNSLSLFAAFKDGIRTIGESLAKKYNFEFIWGRIFFAYGMGQRASSLVPSCIESFRKNIVPIVNNPYVINDFVHINDVADSIFSLIKTKKSEGIFNIASGTPYLVGDVVNIIAEVMGKEHLLEEQQDKQEGTGFWGNISKLTKFTDHVPKYTFREGIRQLIDRDEFH